MKKKEEQDKFLRSIERKGNLSRFGRKVLNYINFLKKRYLSIQDIMESPLYITPHSCKNSKQYFMYVKTGNYNEVRSLCFENKMMVFQMDSVGKIGAHWAALREDISMMRLLIRFKTDLEKRDFNGCTPLSYALKTKNRDIVFVIILFFFFLFNLIFFLSCF